MGGDHKCPVCQATFTRPQHVARHMRSHTGDRPYKCQYCGDQFARSDLLSRHVNKCHANEKPLPPVGNSRRKVAASRAATSKQACDQCVTGSLPCDGCNPCAKCISRKIRCTFVKFHRQTAPAGPGHTVPAHTLSALSSIGAPISSATAALHGPIGSTHSFPMAIPSSRTSSQSSADSSGMISSSLPTRLGGSDLFSSDLLAPPGSGSTSQHFNFPYNGGGGNANTAGGSTEDFSAKYRANAELFHQAQRRASIDPSFYQQSAGSWGQQQQQGYGAGGGGESQFAFNVPESGQPRGRDLYADALYAHHSRTSPGSTDSSRHSSVASSHRSAYNDFSSDSSSSGPHSGQSNPHSYDSSPASQSTHSLNYQQQQQQQYQQQQGGYDAYSGYRPTSSHSNYSAEGDGYRPSTSSSSSSEHHSEHGHGGQVQGEDGRPTTGSREFSSAFGLMSLDDPNVLAGLGESEGFFGEEAALLNSMSTDPNATPMALAGAKRMHDNGKETPREAETRELREFWRTYMRTPGSAGPGGGPVQFPGSSSQQQQQQPEPHQNPQTPMPGGPRRHRVSSLPSVKTPTAEAGLEGKEYLGSGSADMVYDGTHQAQEQQQPMRTHNNPEDLRSYEAAVLARKAPTQLNLAPKFKAPRRKMSGAAGASPPDPSSPHVASHVPSSLAEHAPPPMIVPSHHSPLPQGHHGHGHGHAYQPPPMPPWNGTDVNGYGDSSGGNGMAAARPSFKRLASTTLGPENTKRAMWDLSPGAQV